MKGRPLALILAAATIVLVFIGTEFPAPSAEFYAGAANILHSASTPQAAVQILADQIRGHAYGRAYGSLANKAEFSQNDFIRDLTGSYANLLTYSSLEKSEVKPLHASESDADMQLKLYWATVVGTSITTRNIHVVKTGSTWKAEWPLVKEAKVPPQVISVPYLRWDVIYRGGGDDWGVQDVETPHIKLVDMQPIERADGVVIMGELLNEDVVPAYVSVSATLLSKTKTPIATEGSFDKISHLLLPKQVTPFFIKFPGRTLAEVGSIRMDPKSNLIAAAADPIVEINNEQLHPVPDASLTGQLINQGGQVVNIAHVLGTFYDKNGQVVWVADQYVEQALAPGIPVNFQIRLPEDLAKNIATQRTVISTYQSGGNL